MVAKHRDILFACVGGFIAWGLITSWYPLIRFVGYSFLLGVAATLAFFIIVLIASVRSPDNSANPSKLCGQPMAFLSPDNWQRDSNDYRNNTAYNPAPLYPQSFIVSAALDELLHFTRRDFIGSWYGHISSNPKFADEIDSIVRATIGRIKDWLSKEDFVEIFVSRIVPIVTSHLKDVDLAERAVRGRNLSHGVTESEELEIAIAARYREGNIHPAAAISSPDVAHVQQEHLRKVVVSLLSVILPTSQANSRAVSVLTREILACAVLLPLIGVLADPDTWNQLMEAYGRTALQDRKTVRRLREALDQHALPLAKSKQAYIFPKLSPNDSEREFERFVRAIRRCNNLSDARRFRNNVASQLKRETMFDGQDPIYIRRLETAKRALDQKVAKLSTPNGAGNTQLPISDQPYSNTSRPQDISLVDVMHNAAGLSYFMEYMDRLGLMSLVQFWIVVDGFKNPLENDIGDDISSAPSSWTTADRNDMILLSENHLSKPELKVDEESRNIVKSFISAGKRASPEQYWRARKVVLATQSAVLDEMKRKYYPAFKRSDLYYKYLASDEAAAATSTASPSQQPNRLPPSRSHTPGNYQTSRVSSPMLRTDSQSSMKPDSRRKPSLFSSDALDTGPPLDPSYPPLFSDDIEPDILEASINSLGKDSQSGEADIQTEIVLETMEAALNDIISDSPSAVKADGTKSGQPTPSPRASLDMGRADGHAAEKGKPNISSLGLVNTSSRIGVFTDDDLFPDQEKFIEDEYADPDMPEHDIPIEEEIHEAAPGDLGLTEAISALTADIEKLVSQEAVIDSLTRKAELTNNVAELRILGKSKSSLRREIRRKEMQRQQYIVQESDNSLYGRSTVQIPSIILGKESDGREYALYVIEVKRKAGEQIPVASWAVPRRYSEFHELHQRLRARYPSVRGLEFPRRHMVMKLHKDVLHKRRLALESYLKQIFLLPDVCGSRDLRSFLSQRAIGPTREETGEGETRDIVTRLYNSVADGMDDFLGNIAVLDQLSTAGQNLISAATSQLSASQAAGLGPEEAATAAEAEAELNAFEDRELEPFIKPICDIFLEIFELTRGNNWLRGRAAVVVLHQLLGGTIERKVRENVKSLLQDASLLHYIGLIKDTMWPGGKLREAKVRTGSEKMKSRTEASVMLATLIPELAAGVVGRANAQTAARRIFSTLNNPRLNLHLVYTILDEILLILANGR
ncbi:tRNA (guanine-N(7)-)-methyltransferase (tRNA(m7G46)-methyltransferase) [Microsporum audouinii]